MNVIISSPPIMRRLIVATMVMMMPTMTTGLRMVEVAGERLKGVSVGVSGVWGVDRFDRIFYRNNTYRTTDNMGAEWIPVQGRLSQIDVGDNIVWGVTRNYVVYFRRGISGQNPTGGRWEQVPGSMKHVSVSPGWHVWTVNGKDDIFTRVGTSKANPQGNSWRRISGKLRQISVGTAGVWGVNHHYDVFYRNNTFGDYGFAGNNWIRVPGQKMVHVSSTFGNVLAVSVEGRLHVRMGMSFTRPTGNRWRRIRPSDRHLLTVDSLHGDIWATKHVADKYIVLYSFLTRQC